MPSRPKIRASRGRTHLTFSIAVALLLAFSVTFIGQPPTVAAQSPCGNTVTVVFGDTLREIAARCNTSVSAILAANPEITNPDIIRVGQEILIPANNGNTGDPSVTIAPDAGPPGSIIDVTATGFPENTELIIGLGEPQSEAFTTNQVVTNAQGMAETSFTVPEEAEPNQRYTVVAYVPVPDGTRDTSNNFIVTSGSNAPPDGDQPVEVQITPTSGAPGTTVQVTANGLPANATIDIGTGPVDSEYDIIAIAQTNAQGELNRAVSIPERVEPGQRWVIVVTPAGSTADYISNPFLVTQPSDGEGSQDLFTRTNIYLIALEDAGHSGMQVGCGDSIVPVEVQIEPTLGILRAAMEQLVNLDERFYGQSGLYNALYRSNLDVDEVTIQDSTAIIRLSGQVSLGGVCDTPRFTAQLRQTALQYYTVDNVEIFINGEPLDSAIQ